MEMNGLGENATIIRRRMNERCRMFMNHEAEWFRLKRGEMNE